MNDSLAEIYSIIVTLDAIEKAYLKDSIAEADYTETCSRLLKQYKSNLANEAVARAFGDLEQFKKEWDVRDDGMTHFWVLVNMASDGMPSGYRTTARRHTGHD